MALMSNAAWLVGAIAAALLAGCSSSQPPNTGADLQQKVASTTAACNGYVRAFGDATSQAASLTCSGTERPYVAYADSIAHRFSPCAFTFEPASGSQGRGQMTCSNGAAGPLTYDMTNPINIIVVATLDDGRQMAFTLREH